jgi:hypothetical protein
MAEESKQPYKHRFVAGVGLALQQVLVGEQGFILRFHKDLVPYRVLTGWNRVLPGIGAPKLAQQNLKYIRARAANLRGAKLQSTDLSETQFQGADLRVADLQGAILKSANLQKANLNGTKLQGSNLEFVNLQGASLVGAKLQGAELFGAELQGADFGQAKLQSAILIATWSSGVNLSEAIINTHTIFDYDPEVNRKTQLEWLSKGAVWVGDGDPRQGIEY